MKTDMLSNVISNGVQPTRSPLHVKLGGIAEVHSKVAQVYQTRTRLAQEHFVERTGNAWREWFSDVCTQPQLPWDFWNDVWRYGVDCAQRSILFWDTMSQRGNGFIEHERAGKPPLLHFDYETVLDARTFKRPAN